MVLITGLGNPGNTYKGTRHNIGFEAIDKMAYDFGISMKPNRRFKAVIGEGRIGGKQVILAQPQTFMNLSGEAVRAITQFYKIPAQNLIVIYDDIALPVGDIRVRQRGSSGGQKGMVSIIAQLKTEEFPRVRIGIGEKPPGFKLADYVLSRFFKEEHEAMIKGVTNAGDAVELIIKEGTDSAMNKYNKKAAAKPTARPVEVNPKQPTRPEAEKKEDMQDGPFKKLRQLFSKSGSES